MRLKRSKWIECTPCYDSRMNEYIDQYECQECGYFYLDYDEDGPTDFCPGCGAKMGRKVIKGQDND